MWQKSLPTISVPSRSDNSDEWDRLVSYPYADAGRLYDQNMGMLSSVASEEAVRDYDGSAVRVQYDVVKKTLLIMLVFAF